MAFASTRSGMNVSGAKRVTYGTWTNGSADSGGEIDTGLKYCHAFVPSVSSHLGSENVKVSLNSSSSGKVTIVTSTGADGDWVAIGI